MSTPTIGIRKPLPSKYAWLDQEKAPKVLIEALRHYGVLEHVGKGSNAEISAWAKELGVNGYYTDDDIPWCGLFVGICASRAGYAPPKGLLQLGAKNWLQFGSIVNKGQEMLFDILVFNRDGGGHVGFYILENKDNFLVYGGNQSNSVGFAWISKSRLVGARRPVYKIAQPANIRKIFADYDGTLSSNEK